MKVKSISRIIEPIANRTRFNIIKKKNRLWVSATKTHNYFLNDHLSDWLNLYGRSENINYKNRVKQYEKNFKSFLLNKGIEFEKEVINFYKLNFDCMKIADFYTLKDAKYTFKMMEKGIPIIYSAPVYNNTNNTYGIIDLLVRSDYINNMFTNNIIDSSLETKKAPNLPGNYHYRVIDIKYSTLNLCSDGKHLINSGRTPGYKSQLCVYNKAISEFQGYDPEQAYILGRRWKYRKNNQYYTGNRCNDKLGVIDFSEKDNSFIDRTDKAIEWYRNVNKKGINWCIYPPTIPELYPNMCQDSGQWNQMKNKISNNIGEITMLWNCGIKHREKCHKEGIMNWKDDRCNSKTLGFKENTQISNIIDNLIKVNRNDEYTILYNNIENWPKETENEMFVDFETFSDVCDTIDNIPYQNKFNIIFMIGVGMKINGKWFYKSYICNDKTKREEKRIMNEFYNDYKRLNKPPVYFWSAEKNFWNRSSKEHKLRTNINWIDMCGLFKKHNISIKDCFGFGLKNIVNCMKKHNFISTKLDSECSNGMMAMIKAWNCYNNIDNPDICAIMKDIEKYNEFDCKAIYDIMEYIRNNCH
jgi:hypothetical protein